MSGVRSCDLATRNAGCKQVRFAMEHDTMRKLTMMVLSALALVASATLAAAASPKTPDDAKALVEKAATFVKSNGRDKALAVFNDPTGEFRDGELYIYALDGKDSNLTMLAHGANKALVGKPQLNVKDADGKSFNHETVAIASTKGEGWVEYKWSNPATKKIEAKISFIKLVDGIILGAGVYKH
jgi:signal transduction histidine kinase